MPVGYLSSLVSVGYLGLLLLGWAVGIGLLLFFAFLES